MTKEPRVYVEDYGASRQDKSLEAFIKSNQYRELSTIRIFVTRGVIPARVVMSWLNLIKPLNQMVASTCVEGMEVGNGYEWAIKEILNSKARNEFKYILTMEEDNIPPPDGLLKLYESITEYDVVGGLYFHKGLDGFPIIFGDPSTDDTRPQIPRIGEVQECNALGMGFTLFRMSMFTEGKITPPFFKTNIELKPGEAIDQTQDLFFFKKAKAAGYRFAVDTRVRVGHMDVKTGVVW